MKKVSGPWVPVHYDSADATAIQALMEGIAEAHQQQRAMKWIIEVASGMYDLSYRPGEDGRRDTDFAEGRRFVGSQIVKLSRLNVSALRRSEE